MDMSPPADEVIKERLKELEEDKESAIKARIAHYNSQQHHIEEAYKDMLFTV
jgi:guanylate kinase